MEKKEEKNLEIPIETIVNVVSQYLKIPVAKITGKDRTLKVVECRYVAMYFSKEYTAKKLSHIGEYFGGRKSGSVSNALKSLHDLMSYDSSLCSIVEEIRIKLCSINSVMANQSRRVSPMPEIPSHERLAFNFGVRLDDVLRRL